MMGISAGSSCAYMWGSAERDSRMVAIARRHPTEASAPVKSSSSVWSCDPFSFQNAATRFWVMPMAYGAISSPNFSTMVSRVNTISSDSTSFISAKNSSRSWGRMGRIWEMSSVVSTKDPSDTMASTFTGRSGSLRQFTTPAKSAMKFCGLVKSISAYTPAHHAALALT